MEKIYSPHRPLQKNNIPFYARQVFGEILFGLTYLPTAQRLSFSVIKATNLRYEEVGVEKTEEFRKFKPASPGNNSM